MFTPPAIRELPLSRTDNRPNKPFEGGLAAFITVHQTGNPKPGADAHAHARWMAREAPYSWHATIDDREVWRSLGWGEQGWHAGDGADGPGNATSIGLEICVNEDGDGPAAVRNAAWLVARLRAEGHGARASSSTTTGRGRTAPCRFAPSAAAGSASSNRSSASRSCRRARASKNASPASNSASPPWS